jgi:type IV secretion system protein TrbI
METAKDKSIPPFVPIESPTHLEIRPKPKNVVRLSRKGGLALGGVGLLLLAVFAYGGYKRTEKAQLEAREQSEPKRVTPATQAALEITKSAPTDHASERTMSYRFNPETGEPCNRDPRRPYTATPVGGTYSTPYAVPSAQPSPLTPEEQRAAAAEQRQRDAMAAPTSIRNSGEKSSSFPEPGTSSSSSNSAQFADLTRLLPGVGYPAANDAPGMQSSHAAQLPQSFLSAANKQTDDYLHAVRTAPLSSCEVKAGWEIPAVLEQTVNSDLPGEIKALVTSHVYDTATGRCLAIPQGSRLVGKYDSRVSYGQDGVQVLWSRLLFPDGSSLDLDGMVGLDAQGNAGLRGKVDHHYKRLVGMSALSSVFIGAFALSQRSNQTPLAYPSPGQLMASGAAQEVAQTGSQITRKNLDVQPTIRIPAGYQFTVRVDRDMLFAGPYQPMDFRNMPIGPGQQNSALEMARYGKQ